jgi:hypothetical protein
MILRLITECFIVHAGQTVLLTGDLVGDAVSTWFTGQSGYRADWLSSRQDSSSGILRPGL